MDLSDLPDHHHVTTLFLPILIPYCVYDNQSKGNGSYHLSLHSYMTTNGTSVQHSNVLHHFVVDATVQSTDGSTKTDSNMAETDVRLEEPAVIEFLVTEGEDHTCIQQTAWRNNTGHDCCPTMGKTG
jgi:hypothetical protein